MPKFSKTLLVSEIVEITKTVFKGFDQEVVGILPLNEATAGYVCFYRGHVINDNLVRALNNGAVVFTSVTECNSELGTKIISDHPEEDFCNLIELALRKKLLLIQESNAPLYETIGAPSGELPLGSAIILSGVEVGSNCIFKPLSVIGAPGFGVFRDRESNYRHFPHVGGVTLGDNVEIGTASTVASGTLTPTKIGNYTKIDDHVHVAHNVQIGENVVICAGVIIGGGATIGDNVWIGMKSVIRDGVSVGDDIVLGMGTLVTKSINRPGLYIGQPAKFLRSEV
jgi:UDP-3-O-[3-hydroxymyristoyl] glucosamine N-acyltransferase